MFAKIGLNYLQAEQAECPGIIRNSPIFVMREFSILEPIDPVGEGWTLLYIHRTRRGISTHVTHLW